MREPVLQLDGIDNEACNILFNIYDCSGADAAFYVVLLGATTSALLAGYCCLRIVERLRGKLSMSVARRVDGTWLLVPLTSVLILVGLTSTLRTLHFTLLLLDQPRSWIARSVLTLLVYIMFLVTLHIGSVGTIAHTPAEFTKRHGATGRTTIHVPTARAIFWIMASGSFDVISANTACFVWLGWTRTYSPGDHFAGCLQFLTLPVVVFFSIHLFTSCYYCHKLRRIATPANSHRSHSSRIMQAARGLFRVHALMVIASVCFLVSGIAHIVLARLALQHAWIHQVITAPLHTVLLPLLMVCILRIMLRNLTTFDRCDYTPGAIPASDYSAIDSAAGDAMGEALPHALEVLPADKTSDPMPDNRVHRYSRIDLP